jgi:NTE family protein
VSGNSVYHSQVDTVRIEALSIPLAIISTELDTGKLYVFDKGPLYIAMRASSAIPGVFDPIFYKGKRLIDGGILGGDHVRIAKKMNAEIVIVSNVSVSTTMDENRVSKRIFRFASKYVSENEDKLIFKENLKKNTITSILLHTLLIIEQNQKIEPYWKNSKPDFIIEPVRNEIKPFDFYKVNEGYELGRRAALEIIDEIVKKVYE